MYSARCTAAIRVVVAVEIVVVEDEKHLLAEPGRVVVNGSSKRFPPVRLPGRHELGFEAFKYESARLTR